MRHFLLFSLATWLPLVTLAGEKLEDRFVWVFGWGLGTDYEPLNTELHPWWDDTETGLLKIPSGSRIQEGEQLRVSWYHSAIVHDSQVTVCMAEPALYETFDHEAKLLKEKLNPRRVFLNMNAIRMGGTCRACGGRDMAELLGECITKQTQMLRRRIPGARVYVWSDMLDPNHNAHGDYYLAIMVATPTLWFPSRT